MGLGDMNAFLPSYFQSANSVLWKEKKKKNEENLLSVAVINAGSLTLTDDRLNIVNFIEWHKNTESKEISNREINLEEGVNTNHIITLEPQPGIYYLKIVDTTGRSFIIKHSFI